MSDHELPEDLSLWPRDPYQLLGVKPGVTPKELRQAYTRLIRRFKPEQFPEHFRLIREAYDQARQHGMFFFQLTSPWSKCRPSLRSHPQTFRTLPKRSRTYDSRIARVTWSIFGNESATKEKNTRSIGSLWNGINATAARTT